MEINNKPKVSEKHKRKIESIEWKFEYTKLRSRSDFRSKHLCKAIYPSQDIKVSQNIARKSDLYKTKLSKSDPMKDKE